MTLWTILYRESVDAKTEEIGSVYVDLAGPLPFKVRLMYHGQRDPTRWPRYVLVEGRRKKKGG